MRYTLRMSIAILSVLAVIVGFVAIDTIARREQRSPRRDQTFVTTEKIIVDLTQRR